METIDKLDAPESDAIEKFPLPYPQFIIGFAIGGLLAITLSGIWYSHRYGIVMDALPKYERAREDADKNDSEIRKLVERNAENAKIMNESSEAIVNWAKGMKPRTQTVSK